MSTLKAMFVILLAAGAARAETPCEDCWSEQCKEFRSMMPKCKQAAKPAPATATAKRCEPGKVRSRDTQGQCCWPGQSYNSSKKKCIGEPECPSGYELDGEECTTSVACPDGTEWNGAACAGEVQCPAGSKWDAAKQKCAAPSATSAGEARKDPKTGITWLWVPAGTFSFGCVDGDRECDSDEQKPAVKTQVEGFWLAKTETTVAQYAACAAAGECSTEPRGQDTEVKACNWKNGRITHPMNCLSWSEALSFCQWAGGRLPAATEWEYAAKAGRDVIFPWGNARPDGVRANYCDKNCPAALTDDQKKLWAESSWVALQVDDGWAATAPAGSFPAGANRWGLLDMAGNVWEWTDTDYDAQKKEQRGGSWYDTPLNLRASFRIRRVPTVRNFSFGFLCAQ